MILKAAKPEFFLLSVIMQSDWRSPSLEIPWRSSDEKVRR